LPERGLVPLTRKGPVEQGNLLKEEKGSWKRKGLFFVTIFRRPERQIPPRGRKWPGGRTLFSTKKIPKEGSPAWGGRDDGGVSASPQSTLGGREGKVSGTGKLGCTASGA